MNKNISLVLGSGGARGLAHIGVIHWLNENRFKIKSISGCSMGPLFDVIRASISLPLFFTPFKRNGVNGLTGMFTAPTDDSNKLFTQEKYEVGAAIGWSGAQMVDNIYETSGNFPIDTCYQTTFKDPKNKAFWSITVYDKAGFMFNDRVNLSSNTATPNADGTYTISFGRGGTAPLFSAGSYLF